MKVAIILVCLLAGVPGLSLAQDVAAPASEELAPGLYAAAVLSADPEQSRYVDTTEKTYGDPYSSLSVVNLDPNYCYGKLVQNISYPTNWTSDVDPSAPRNNYPRPAMRRVNPRTWQSLNGLWEFYGGDGPVPFNQSLPQCILVPYPMESDLSGVAEYHPVAYYRRVVVLPPYFADRMILLHANRVDWNVTYWVNGILVGNHLGGFDAHAFDITMFLMFDGSGNEFIMRVEDPTDDGPQLIGKQRIMWQNDADLQYQAALHDRPNEPPLASPIVSPPVSGPWSTVWLESLPIENFILSVEPFADLDCNCVNVSFDGHTNQSLNAWIQVTDGNGKDIQGWNMTLADTMQLGFVDPVQPWTPESPTLYYARMVLLDPAYPDDIYSGFDAVDFYFGFRKLEVRNTSILIPNTTINVPHIQLNGNPEPYFYHGVLWQSYFSDGFFAGATDQQYTDFVNMVKAMGFNLLRVHGKVEDPQLYHAANTLGLVIMQDIPSACGIPAGSIDLNYRTCWTYERDQWDDWRKEEFLNETVAIVRELRRNPAVFIFTAFNEGWGQHDTPEVVATIRQESPQTLVNGGSGWVHQLPGVDDVVDLHDYFTTLDYPMHMDASPLLAGDITDIKLKIGKVPILGEYGGTGMMVPGHYYHDNTTCRTYTPLFDGKHYSVTNTSGDDLKDTLAYFQWGISNLAYRGLLGASVYTGLSDQITECNGLWTWDFQMLKYGQIDFLVPHFQNVSESFATTVKFI